jgi:hypothetical protein
MSAIKSWIDESLPLLRPEYAQQTESLLTDLIWRSPGSSLALPGGKSYLDKLAELHRENKKLPGMERLIPEAAPGVETDLVQTMPLAEKAGLDSLVAVQAGACPPTKAVLRSILAPMAKGNKSLPCVPIHPEAVVLQSLHGMVNKESPPNLANVIEVVGWLGGAAALGSVACSFLQALGPGAQPREGITGLVDALFPLLARDVWAQLPTLSKDPAKALPPWPGVSPVPPTPAGHASLVASNHSTPFSWFWKKWSILCAQANRWYDVLPTRRFIDWAQCLLRTGLAFAYIWEAEFFSRVHGCLVEVRKAPGR